MNHSNDNYINDYNDNKINNSNLNIINYYSFHFYPDDFNPDLTNQNVPYIIVKKNNKKIALFEVTNEYPLKPPKTIVYTNFDSRGYTTYLNWSLKRGQIMRSFLIKNKINKSTLFLLWFFIITKNFYIINGKKFKDINDFNLEPFTSNYCFCSSTILCSQKWDSNCNIIDIVTEILLRNDLFNLCNEKGVRYILPIFNNSKWELPEDILYHILSFIIDVN